MTKSKTTKRALLVSALSMLLCLAMLVGTTFAWFTDTVTTGKNVIQAGNLDISAEVFEVSATGEDAYSEDTFFAVTGAFLNSRIEGGEDVTLGFPETGTDLEGNENFMSGELFEPGKTYVKLIRVTNNGSLATKVSLHFNVEDGGLQDALWFSINATTTSGDMQIDVAPMSTLNEVLSGLEIVLYPKGVSGGSYQQDIYFAYGMNREAGNEYQGKSFTAQLTILATQYTYEEDGFDDQYDKDAFYPAITDLTANDAESFSSAIAEATAGDIIALTSDIDFGASALNIYGTNDITIDGQGRTITASDSKQAAVFCDINMNSGNASSGITVKNLVIDATGSNCWSCAITSGITFENCTFINGDPYITPKDNAKDVTFTNCTFENASITIACAEGSDECNLTMTGNTFILTQDNKCAFALYVRAADGFGTKNNSSALKTTVTGNTFVNKTGAETYCAYQVLQEARKTGDNTSLLLNSENADVPVYSENTYDSGAGYIYEERTSSPKVTSDLIPINQN